MGTAVCALLISRGANVRLATTRRLISPLHIASYVGQANICKLLLKHGASVNQTTEGGMTPLSIAINSGVHFGSAERRLSYRCRRHSVHAMIKVLLWHGGRVHNLRLGRGARDHLLTCALRFRVEFRERVARFRLLSLCLYRLRNIGDVPRVKR